jgi:hypothetical protein
MGLGLSPGFSVARRMMGYTEIVELEKCESDDIR